VWAQRINLSAPGFFSHEIDYDKHQKPLFANGR